MQDGFSSPHLIFRALHGQHPLRLLRFGSGAPGRLGRGIYSDEDC